MPLGIFFEIPSERILIWGKLARNLLINKYRQCKIMVRLVILDFANGSKYNEKYMEEDMEILFRILFFIAFALLASRMMRGGGCCGGGHKAHNSKSVSSCCSGPRKHEEGEGQ